MSAAPSDAPERRSRSRQVAKPARYLEKEEDEPTTSRGARTGASEVRRPSLPGVVAAQSSRQFHTCYRSVRSVVGRSWKASAFSFVFFPSRPSSSPRPVDRSPRRPSSSHLLSRAHPPPRPTSRRREAPPSPPARSARDGAKTSARSFSNGSRRAAGRAPTPTGKTSRRG
jgi:hypothetical protein